MAGGTLAVVAGGGLLATAAGAGIQGVRLSAELLGKEDTIFQSAKLIVTAKNVFLAQDETELVDSIYEQYVDRLRSIGRDLVDYELEADVAKSEDKRELSAKIKRAEEAMGVMKIARRTLLKARDSGLPLTGRSAPPELTQGAED
jgi:hypothetical protein